METFIPLPPRKHLTNQMNVSSLSAAAIAALFLVACGPSEAEIAEQKAKATADSLAALAGMEHTYAADLANSKVMWTGTMLGVKSHNGTVALTDGKITTKGGQLVSGSFAVDLNSIAPLDTNYAPEGAKQYTKTMLIGHLKSADFFAVDSFPTAMFEISSVEGNVATGMLTVRGKTHEEKVTDIVITENGDMVTASGNLVFDRQKYGVAWSSGAKDMVLNDNIELSIEMSGKAAM